MDLNKAIIIHESQARKNEGDGSMIVSSTQHLGEGSTTRKRGRGRPRGTGKLQMLASIGGIFEESAVGNVNPHMMRVNTGEDAMSKLLAFSSAHKVSVTVLSAYGTVSSAIIHSPGTSAGGVRHEGRFAIIRLSGSCNYIGVAGRGQSKSEMKMNISLAKTDGSVFGGSLDNTLIAASPLQLIIASFKRNKNKKLKMESGSESGSMPTTTSTGEPADNHVSSATTSELVVLD